MDPISTFDELHRFVNGHLEPISSDIVRCRGIIVKGAGEILRDPAPRKLPRQWAKTYFGAVKMDFVFHPPIMCYIPKLRSEECPAFIPVWYADLTRPNHVVYRREPIRHFGVVASQIPEVSRLFGSLADAAVVHHYDGPS